jgi:hypothetical protein
MYFSPFRGSVNLLQGADAGMRSQHTTMKQSEAKGTKENEAEYIME